MISGLVMACLRIVTQDRGRDRSRQVRCRQSTLRRVDGRRLPRHTLNNYTTVPGSFSMKRSLALVAAGACANALVSFAALAQGAPEVTLTRMADCGTPQAPTAVNQR